MADQVFSDGIGQVTVIGGVVRLDFIAYSPTEKDAKGQPQAVFCQRIIMSADSFLRSAEKIQEAAQAIAKLGPRPREIASVEATPAPAAPAPQASGVEASPPPKRPFP